MTTKYIVTFNGHPLAFSELGGKRIAEVASAAAPATRFDRKTEADAAIILQPLDVRCCQVRLISSTNLNPVPTFPNP